MKTSLFLGATLAALGLAVATTQGQTQSSTTTSSSTGYVQTSKIVGMKVKDSRGEDVGVVKDVVLDRNTGCMAYTVLSTGGGGTRITGGGKTVAVPWTVYTTTADPSIIMVRVDRERIYNAPAFDYARIDEYSTSGWIDNVYSYYGVAPTVGLSVGVSGISTTGAYGTQTGVSGQVSATASPAVAVSPAATAMPSPSATVATSPRATVSPSATARTTPAASASRRASTTPSSSATESTREGQTHRRSEGSATASPSEGSSTETTPATTTEHGTTKHHRTGGEETTSERSRSKSESSEEAPAAEPTATP